MSQSSQKELVEKYHRLGGWSLVREVDHRGRTVRWEQTPADNDGWYLTRITDDRIDWINKTGREL